ncbi:uncharacterized protein LOC124368830 [Homalodisca vitripennis]|uniref:uncharacterized protein LOC124368830 n=1 Tax=Homalodisca vitripennis TaxID=197043 RepID=UPI001EEBC815|nr:uncharacterized protein LOC124368830 [Homalodisca vitripennis]
MSVSLKFISAILLLFICATQSEKDNVNENKVEDCRKTTNLSKDDADNMVQLKNKPKTKDEKCFLKCFYENHFVAASGKYEMQVNENDPYIVSVEDAPAKTNNLVIKGCIKHATFKDKSEEACELGLIMRLCHQQYSRLATQVVANLILRNEELANEQG